MNAILIAVALLGTIGAVSATILYFVGQKFKVIEDPLIEQVNDILPGANCGGCGFPGCRGFASAIVKAETMDGLFCPVGGQETMDKIASILGRSAPVTSKKLPLYDATAHANIVRKPVYTTGCVAVPSKQPFTEAKQIVFLDVSV